ncbi:uncharacterized protein LOC142407548 [Mycteria americana]|uniref:uncharacterized protein LOC142407548 n=1 Tax=Mycteria americana TaxID=33587 RepID=UPI003F58C4AE
MATPLPPADTYGWRAWESQSIAAARRSSGTAGSPASGEAYLSATRQSRIHRLAAEEPPSPSSPPQPPVNTQCLGTITITLTVAEGLVLHGGEAEAREPQPALAEAGGSALRCGRICRAIPGTTSQNRKFPPRTRDPPAPSPPSASFFSSPGPSAPPLLPGQELVICRGEQYNARAPRAGRRPRLRDLPAGSARPAPAGASETGHGSARWAGGRAAAPTLAHHLVPSPLKGAARHTGTAGLAAAPEGREPARGRHSRGRSSRPGLCRRVTHLFQQPLAASAAAKRLTRERPVPPGGRTDGAGGDPGPGTPPALPSPGAAAAATSRRLTAARGSCPHLPPPPRTGPPAANERPQRRAAGRGRAGPGRGRWRGRSRSSRHPRRPRSRPAPGAEARQGEFPLGGARRC